jgi:xanthine dehydrogenase accessory factor
VGSRRRVLQTFQQLLSEGFTEKQLERVNAPVGLNIGAETPEEIAVSILAEIIQRRRTGANIPAEPMKVKLESVRAAAATRSSNRDQEQSENCNYLGP